MAISPWKQFKLSVLNANQWFRKTPERALNMAYDAANKIRSIEEEHFEGRKISNVSISYSNSTKSYFNSQLNRYLKIIQVRLAEFNTSISVVGTLDQNKVDKQKDKFDQNYQQEFPGRSSIILDKLEFIDQVSSRYYKSSNHEAQELNTDLEIPHSSSSIAIVSSNVNVNNYPNNVRAGSSQNQNNLAELKSNIPNTNFLPRSLLKTFKKIKQELDPEAETEVIRKFRKSQIKTLTSVRFILLVILVPLLIHQLSKITFVGYLVDNFMSLPHQQAELFLNSNMEEEALVKLHQYEDIVYIFIRIDI